ncbi:MAG: glycine cleavage system aminomethyltransferase GcvT [Bacteroidota bacterium]|nr:glycine cleavage system aminomethyltransferase GcvT [Bacteroidota bacterium]
MLKTTPLHRYHQALGARMVPFAGYSMPLHYSGIVDEHMAVRRQAGLFDVSHMGEIFVRGPHATAFVQHLVTNDAEKLSDGQAMYTVMCNHEGGILDDLLVYRLNGQAYMLVVNAANTALDFAWMSANNPMGADLYDVSDLIALLALQGPQALEIASCALPLPIQDLPYYRFLRPEPGSFMGFDKVIVSRTGYTGEPGLEIYVESENAGTLWDVLMEAGVSAGLKPAGLGARDTLRLEAGYCLYGNELSETVNPFEARLSWVTKLTKDNFVGKAALAALKARGPSRVLVGLRMDTRGIPRAGYDVLDAEGTVIGQVTSGSQSPVLKKGIALAFVPAQQAFKALGTQLQVRVRTRLLPATVVRCPFHR